MQLHIIEILRQRNAKPAKGFAIQFLFLLSACRYGSRMVAQIPVSTAFVQGAVSVEDAKGPAYISHAYVTLKGAATLNTETDENGKFEFRQLQPGTYTVEAAAQGLFAAELLTVETGETAQISINLKPAFL
jgi:hypothetical protein